MSRARLLYAVILSCASLSLADTGCFAKRNELSRPAPGLRHHIRGCPRRQIWSRRRALCASVWKKRWCCNPLRRMPQIQCKAMLFDLDGVLIDSTRAVTRVWHRWALEHGFDPDEVIARAHGRPSLTTVREYLPDADHAAENREVERREMEDLEGVVLLPGSARLLAELPPDRWTIVTSCTRPAGRDPPSGRGLADPRTYGHLERHKEWQATSRALPERRVGPGIFRLRTVS